MLYETMMIFGTRNLKDISKQNPPIMTSGGYMCAEMFS